MSRETSTSAAFSKLWDEYGRIRQPSSAQRRSWGSTEGVSFNEKGCPVLVPRSPFTRGTAAPRSLCTGALMAPLMELDVPCETDASVSSPPGCGQTEQEDKHAHALQGVVGSVWNLLNDIIGAPIITVPYFVAICGWSLGLLLLFAYSAISFTTLLIQHKLARIVHAMSFEELCGMAFGRFGLGVSYVSVFMYNFGGFVAGLLVISDSIVKLLVTHRTRSRQSAAFCARPVRTMCAMSSLCAHAMGSYGRVPYATMPMRHAAGVRSSSELAHTMRRVQESLVGAVPDATRRSPSGQL